MKFQMSTKLENLDHFRVCPCHGADVGVPAPGPGLRLGERVQGSDSESDSESESLAGSERVPAQSDGPLALTVTDVLSLWQRPRPEGGAARWGVTTNPGLQVSNTLYRTASAPFDDSEPQKRVDRSFNAIITPDSDSGNLKPEH